MRDNKAMADKLPPAAPGESHEQPALAEDDEYYFDGPYMVFTEAYHLRRGYCCYSGCRHCPYGFVLPASPTPQP
jgi:hypothetical protein